MDSDADPLSIALAAVPQAADILFEPATVVMFVVLVMLLLASAVVSGSEVALFSLDASVKESLDQAKDKASRRVLALLEKPRHLLITILLLNTFINVSAAILAALITENIAAGFGLSRTTVFVLEVIVLTFVLLVISEITPKLIASQHAVTYSRSVSGPLRMFYRILYPIVALLAFWMQRTQWRFQRWFMPDTPERLSTEDLKAMAVIGEAHGSLEEDEREWIHSIVEFGDTSVRAIMINRLDVAALPVTATLPEALELIRTSGHSRLPLYVDHLDNILGIIYAKDLLPYLRNGNSPPRLDWTRLMRPPMFVPQGKKLDDLLKDFQRRKTHLAIVVDEYGGTAGMVTLEDVLEEVVGDIRDEHDEAETEFYEKLDDNHYRVDARIDLDDLNDLLDLDLDTETFDFETLGGLIFHLTGDIPSEGEKVNYGRLTMEVETVENNRIRHVHVQVTAPAEDEDLSAKGAAENS